MLSTESTRVVRLALAVTFSLTFAGTAVADEPKPRETWHLEFRNAGGGADYALPYSPFCFSPDSKLLAVSLINYPIVFDRTSKENDTRLRKEIPSGAGIGIWKVESLEFVRGIEADTKKVIQFTADGKSIAALDDSRLIKWDIKTGEESATALLQESNFSRRLRCGFAIFSNGKTVALTNDGLELFSETGDKEKTFETPGATDVVQIELSADGQQVIADSWYWDLKNDRQLSPKQNHLVHSVFRPGTNEIWGHERFANNAVSVWNTSTGKLRMPLPEGLESNGRAKNGSVQFRVASLAFDPTGELLATVGEDSCIHLWNAANGKRVVTLEVCRADRDNRRSGASVPTLKLVRFSPDGRWLLAGSVRSMSIFDMKRLRKQIKAGKVYQLTQYFAGQNLVEEEVTNPPGRRMPGAADWRFAEVPQPGTPVIAVKKGNPEVWYDAVFLAHAFDLGSRGKRFSIHFEGYSRDSDEIVADWRLRPRKAP